MKAEEALFIAIGELTVACTEGMRVEKGEVAKKVAYLVAALEVFTDLNFTEEEQAKLFDLSAQRLKVLRGLQ